MSDQHVSAYQQLLAATDAIGEVGRASSARLKHTLKHALVCMLAALVSVLPARRAMPRLGWTVQSRTS